MWANINVFVHTTCQIVCSSSNIQCLLWEFNIGFFSRRSYVYIQAACLVCMPCGNSVSTLHLQCLASDFLQASQLVIKVFSSYTYSAIFVHQLCLQFYWLEWRRNFLPVIIVCCACETGDISTNHPPYDNTTHHPLYVLSQWCVNYSYCLSYSNGW